MEFISETEKELAGKFVIGGKAKNLFRLKEIGLNIPKFLIIPQEVLITLVPDEIKNSDYKTIIEFIDSIRIESSLIVKIISHFQNTKYFAVRSSAIDEDGTDFSFAGQFESHLFVTKENIAEKIKSVWRSAFSERVFEYRKNNNLKQKFGIAVIIQEMIDAETAGVAFGINPADGDRNAKVISAVYGLGDGLVSGELNSDNFIIKDKKILSQIAEKNHKIILDNENSGGTKKVEVPEQEKKSSSLFEKQIFEIENILVKCSEEYGKPQDIEFAIAKDKIYLLQARPITNLHKIADSSGEYIIWDNSNIIESYPGITSPLTFSFIVKMYEAVYRQFAGIMGVSRMEIEENSETFSNMLGLLKGRVYYNLLSWYKALALVPGYSINAEFMEKMMGVKERFELKKFKKRNKISERIRVLNMIWIMLRNLHALPEMRKKFQRDFNLVISQYNKINFHKCRADELMNLYLNFEQTLLKKWKSPLVNDFFAMIYFGVMQKLIVKYKISENQSIHNDLLCGARDIISTEPVYRTLAIATMISENAKAKILFLEKSEKDILEFLKTGFENIKFSIDEYIEKFGERCAGELKLETITYKQNPLAFIKILKSYVQQGVTKLPSHSDVEKQLRKTAEEQVAKVLSGKLVKKIIFNYFLKHARILVSQRENLRYERTRGFGIVRQIFCAIGKNFYSEGIIEHPRDIFYLTKEEIFNFIKGTSVNNDFKKLISFRKSEYALFENEKTSERIQTYGIPYHGNNFNKQIKYEELKGDLNGIGCCPGRVKAKIRVVNNPEEIENLNGDILVTSSTDPGWVTLFPTASAILVERGSLLSHSAIVSREMGKPCIVGITGLLDILKSGDIVEMDGSTGEVKIVQKI